MHQENELFRRATDDAEMPHDHDELVKDTWRRTYDTQQQMRQLNGKVIEIETTIFGRPPDKGLVGYVHSNADEIRKSRKSIGRLWVAVAFIAASVGIGTGVANLIGAI